MASNWCILALFHPHRLIWVPPWWWTSFYREPLRLGSGGLDVQILVVPRPLRGNPPSLGVIALCKQTGVIKHHVTAEHSPHCKEERVRELCQGERWQEVTVELCYSIKIQSDEERVETVGGRLAYIWKYRGFLKRTLFGRQQARPGGRGRESLGRLQRGDDGGAGLSFLWVRLYILWWDLGCYGVETWHSGTFQWERRCSRFWSGHWTRDTEVFRALNNCQIHGRDQELPMGSLLGFPCGRLAK